MEINQKEIILLQDLGMLYPKYNSKRKARYGIYKCFCGNEFKTQISKIKNKHTKSCGCVKEINRLKSTVTHNLSKHVLFNTWNHMIDRCYNIKSKSYKNYGSRGISVCSRWLSVENFIEDMYPTFKVGLTLDRINVNGNYEPLNCRWATNFTQSRNTRKLISTNTSGYRGVTFHKRDKIYSSSICVNYKKNHLGNFNTAIEAANAYDHYIIDNNLEHTRNFS